MNELEAFFKIVRDAQLVMIVQKDGTKIALDYELQSLLVQGLMLVKQNVK